MKSIGIQKTYNLTMKSEQHNYAIHDNNKFIISQNSHATAYSVVSSKMLYLKANFPLPFYASVITCSDDSGDKGFEKLKSYRMEAEKHGIRVNRLDINKSKHEVAIIDNELYWSFDKVKGISVDTAKQICVHQPFENFEDFLKKVGTDSKILKPIIALGLFPGDPIKLWKYSEYYKKYLKDVENNIKKEEKYRLQYTGETLDKKLKQYVKEIKLIPFSEFEDFNVSIKEDYMELLLDREKAETFYYGFIWSHKLEKCEGYIGHTIEKFISDDLSVGPLEIQVVDIIEKKGKVTFYRMNVEDATGNRVGVTIWKDDYEIFKNEFSKGNCLRIQVQAPSNGFPTYTFVSYPKYKKKPPKEQDYRVTILK